MHAPAALSDFARLTRISARCRSLQQNNVAESGATGPQTGGFAISPLACFALAFYGLGVFNLFAHLLAVMAQAWPALPAQLNLIRWLASAAITESLLLAFSGRIYPVDLPADVINYYSEYWQRVSGEHQR